MRNSKFRCFESGAVFFKSPWWARPDEKFKTGNKVTCSCGKVVKLRTPLTGSVIHTMVPHHNKPSIEGEDNA